MNEQDDVYNKLKRTQDFRDIMLEFAAETRTHLRYLRDGQDRLERHGCAKGIDDRARLKALEEDHKLPLRRATLIATAVAAAVGGGIPAAKALLEALSK